MGLQTLDAALTALRLRMDRDPRVPLLFVSLVHTAIAVPSVRVLVVWFALLRRCQ